MANTLLTQKELAGIFSVKPRTIRRWREKNLIQPCMFINGRPRYSIDDAMKLANENNTPMQNETVNG